MSKAGIEKSVFLLWFMGACVWCPMVLVLWWYGYESQTFAQASFNSTRLEMVAGIGTLWSVVGAVWLAKLRKTRKT
jgi:membrane protein DedA with SNARE-associated domain